MNDKRLIEVGKVGKPHGVRGELSVIAFNPSSEIWEQGMEVSLRPKNKAARTVVLETIRQTAKGLLVHIDGIEDREAANKLVHALLSVPRDRLPSLDEGEYYHSDVIGASVFVEGAQERVGVVREVSSTNIDLLEIDLDDGERITIPVLADYVLSIGEEPSKVVVRNLDDWRS